jgi:hypothetical protein
MIGSGAWWCPKCLAGVEQINQKAAKSPETNAGTLAWQAKPRLWGPKVLALASSVWLGVVSCNSERDTYCDSPLALLREMRLKTHTQESMYENPSWRFEMQVEGLPGNTALWEGALWEAGTFLPRTLIGRMGRLAPSAGD